MRKSLLAVACWTAAALARTIAAPLAPSPEASFPAEIGAQELVTADLQRIHANHCGAVAFRVDDLDVLLLNFGSIDAARAHARQAIAAAMRTILGHRSAGQVHGQADRIAAELQLRLDQDAAHRGYSVRQLPPILAACLAR